MFCDAFNKINLLNKYDLPSSYDMEKEQLIGLIKHDKKASFNSVNIIRVEDVGSYVIDRIKVSNLEEGL